MPLPVISVAQMRDWENATWASGQTEEEVIRRVGKNLADHALRFTSDGDFILILAGKGHNGDDVRAARKHFANRRVEVLDVIAPEAYLAKLNSAFAQKPALVVDGLFGIGLNRELNDDWKKFIETVNAAGVPVLAMDVPSGLNADTGEHFGAVIRATATLTVGAPKRGLLSASASECVGRLEVTDEVGLLPCAQSSEFSWVVPTDFDGFPPRRAVGGHKGTFGHVGIIAGSLGFHGAAVLAARGTQRARPGLITVFPHEEVYFPVAAQLQAVMVHPWSPKLNAIDRCSALLVGPGLAATNLPEEMKTDLRRYWRDISSPVIVDASALDWLPQGAIPKDTIRVITPHPGEAARLLKVTPAQIQANRPEALRELSRRFGHCWVILKGHQTLIGRSAGEIFVNSSGNADLAQGGAGDVLAGFLAGFLAQPALRHHAEKAICYAVWQHGATADLLEGRKPNWIVEDLIEHLGEAVTAA